jgi:hypothetical protein
VVRDHRTFEFRRSERVPMTIPIEVFGTQQGVFFRETANTLIVSAHGALISVAIPLVEGQGVSVTSLRTRKEIRGEVVSIKPIAGGKRQVAIRFSQPSYHFWDISSQPEDKNGTDQQLGMKRYE